MTSKQQPKATNNEVIMDDWKKRLVDEYNQPKDRYEELKSFNTKREVERYFADIKEPHTPEEKKDARKEYHLTELLRAQQRTMGEYLHLLELRAEIEDICLLKF